ncbi:PilN domain-containing protein [Litchfieldella rifensis]|uniref:PilN domain-containing protein n=1 Tax=Litchfieldella rifensis TaxID=762643 RepID=A0ABV7LQ86_9GAMM
MTIEINLLPWRERVRERRSKRFYLALMVAAVVGVAAGAGMIYHYQVQLVAQQQRNEHIRQQLARLDGDIRSISEYEGTHEQMMERIEIFTRLQRGRPQTVHVFNQLTESLEEGVHYTRLARQGDTLRLTGVAENNRQVSDQLRALARASAFEVPVLSEVEADAGQQQRRFSLSVTQRLSPSEEAP